MFWSIMALWLSNKELIYDYYPYFGRTFPKSDKKAQIIEEQKRANRRKELERNKHRVPDGVVPEDFAKFQPHMPNIL